MTSEGDDVDLARQLQPHLAGLDNPAHDTDIQLTLDNDPSTTTSPSSNPHPTWERFDDNDNKNNTGKRQTEDFNPKPTANPTSVESQNGKSSDADPSSTSSGQQSTAATQHPVIYNCQSGQAVVVAGDVTTASQSGSGSVIATRHIPDRWGERERPLRARQMKILKVLSVIAVIVFFPTGIPAVYSAWRTKREFDEGIMRGNIDRAQKYARRTERLIILSVILAIVITVLVVAIVERAKHGYTVDHSYVAHASVQG